jgi:hypothetical protein
MTTQQDQQETPFTCYFVIAGELMAEIVMKKENTVARSKSARHPTVTR